MGVRRGGGEGRGNECCRLPPSARPPPLSSCHQARPPHFPFWPYKGSGKGSGRGPGQSAEKQDFSLRSLVRRLVVTLWLSADGPKTCPQPRAGCARRACNPAPKSCFQGPPRAALACNGTTTDTRVVVRNVPHKLLRRSRSLRLAFASGLNPRSSRTGCSSFVCPHRPLCSAVRSMFILGLSKRRTKASPT